MKQQVIELQKFIRTNPQFNYFFKELEPILNKLLAYLNTGLSNTCPDPDLKAVGILLREITQLLKSLPEDFLKDLYKILTYNRPASIYQKPLMRLFLLTLGITAFAGKHELLVKTFKVYAGLVFFNQFKKRIKYCDENAILGALQFLTAKSELKKYNLDYVRFVNDKALMYVKFIENSYGDPEKLNRSITHAMDYYKNNINIILRTFANAYYKAKNQSAATPTSIKVSIKTALNTYKLSITVSFKNNLKSAKKIDQAAPTFIKRKALYCTCAKLADDKTFLDNIFKEFLNVTNYIKKHPCTPEWFIELEKIPVSKSNKVKSFKQFIDSYVGKYLKECNPDFYNLYEKHEYYKIEFRKVILKLWNDAVKNNVCTGL